MGESQNRVPSGIVLQICPQASISWTFKSPPPRNGDGPKTTTIGQRNHPQKTAANVFMTGNHGFTKQPGRIWHCAANASNSNPTPVLQSKTCLGIGEQGEDANDLPEFPVHVSPTSRRLPYRLPPLLSQHLGAGQSPSHLLTFFLLLCVLFLCFGVWVGVG